MHARQVTVETVVLELRRACQLARRSRGVMSVSIVAVNRERAFRYDGVTDQWIRV